MELARLELKLGFGLFAVKRGWVMRKAEAVLAKRAVDEVKRILGRNGLTRDADAIRVEVVGL